MFKTEVWRKENREHMESAIIASFYILRSGEGPLEVDGTEV